MTFMQVLDVIARVFEELHTTAEAPHTSVSDGIEVASLLETFTLDVASEHGLVPLCQDHY